MTVPDRPSGLNIPTPDGKDEWWPGQQETIAQVVEAFRDHRFVLANVPTGGGKTIVATAVQRILGGKSVFLTHTRHLQEQYRKTAAWAEVAMGRNNYECPRASGFRKLYKGQLTAEACGEHHGACATPEACPYPQMLARAAINPQVVMNYAYALRILRTSRLKLAALPGGEAEDENGEETGDGYQSNPFWRDLLVCDEGDLLEGALIEATKLTINYRACKEMNLPIMPQLDTPSTWVLWAREALPIAREFSHTTQLHIKEAADTDDDKLGMYALRYRVARKIVTTLSQLVSLAPTDWMVGHGSSAVTIRPLWAWDIASSQLFRYFPRILIMSATLGDPELLTKRLGIKDSYAFIDRPSVFPIENRPVFYWPVIQINRKTEPAEWEAVGSAINFLAQQSALRDRKGLIHTGSYKVAQALKPYLNSGRFLIHDQAKQREVLLEGFMSSPLPLILASPSFTTGLDYEDIGWQVIVKVPFGNLGDRVIKLRHQFELPDDPRFGRKAYDDEALNTVVQAAGRAVRSPTDQGVTYIIDASFWPLYKRGHAPEFFKQALRWLR